MAANVSKYSSVTAVLNGILPLVPEKPQVEVVSPAEAYGRIAANDVASPSDVPLMDSSHMDGFAIVSEDTEKASKRNPVILSVAGTVVLGSKPRGVLRHRQAYRVSTGSFLPPGADAVLPIEDVSVIGNRIGVTAPVPRGLFVFETGGDVRKHQVVVEGGRSIRAQDVGLAVSLGIRGVEVFRRPRVAILATGSELTESKAEVGARVRNSHTHVFKRLAEESGCVAVSLGIVPDVREEITSRIESGLEDTDAVFTTGGTSVGRMDLLDDAVRSLKPAAMFHGIKMDRGRVTGVAVVRGKPIVMMPGPAQGAMNAFVLFGIPILKRLSGRVGGDIVVRAKLKARWEARKRFPAFTKVVYVRLLQGSKGPVAEPVTGETESMTILTRSNAFLVLPERTTSLEAGSEVDALLMPGFSFV